MSTDAPDPAPDAMSETEIRAAALAAAAYLDGLAPEGVLVAAAMYAHWIETGAAPAEPPSKRKLKAVP